MIEIIFVLSFENRIDLRRNSDRIQKRRDKNKPERSRSSSIQTMKTWKKKTGRILYRGLSHLCITPPFFPPSSFPPTNHLLSSFHIYICIFIYIYIMKTGLRPRNIYLILLRLIPPTYNIIYIYIYIYIIWKGGRGGFHL